MTAPRPNANDQRLARQSRLVGLVMLATVAFWLGGQWVGGKLGMDPRYAFLIDFAAMAAFVWVLVVTYQIWRKRQG